jgi:maleylacetoacetate isomerase
MGEVVLQDYWRSSSAYRVRMGLNLAGIAYRAVPVDLAAGAQTAAAYLSVNPQALVPVLDIDGLRLTQSLAILEYLEETRAPGFLPADPAGRARVRALAMAVAMDIQPVCNLRVARRAVAAAGGALEMKGWMQPWIAAGLAAVEAMLDGGPFCHGARVTLADLCLLPQVYNALRWEVDLTPLPRIRGIAAALDALPAIAAAHPDRVKPA